MKVKICENYAHISEEAAKLVAAQVTVKPDSVLGLATGSTPIGMYSRLSKMNDLDFSEIITFNLDEYYPIAPENEQSYHYFMQKHLFSKINIKKENIHILDGATDNPKEECCSYDKKIALAGGIDLQILGIGRNGHIGFNEPDVFLESYTHIVELTENTILANARFFESSDQVPRHALTMGMAGILQAKMILLLISGKEKHEALSGMLQGKLSTDNPSSLLNLHANTVVLCDKEAYYG